MKGKKLKDLIQFFLLLAIVVVVNVIVSVKFFRVDLTSEGRYSLSDATKDLLQSFDEPLLVKVYLQGNFPADFQRLQRETKQMLDEFRAYNSNVEYQFIDPAASEDPKTNRELADQLQYKGLKSYELNVKEKDGSSVQQVFPGAIMNYGEKEVAVSLLIDQLGVSPERQINASVQNLEYALANSIKSMVAANKPSIGFLQGHDELTPRQMADFARILSQNYNVSVFDLRKLEQDSITGEIDLQAHQRNLNRFNALVVAKPQKAFNDLDKFLLDQFAMTGGKIIWLLDAVYADMDSLSENPQFVSFPIYDRLNLSDMLFKYGVRVNTNLVLDKVAAGVSDTRQIYPWIYFPMVMPQVNHPITKEISGIKLEFPSSVDTVKAVGVKKTVLLRSSPYSTVLATPHIVKVSTLFKPPGDERFKDKNVPLAVLLEGEFESSFKNRIKPKASNAGALKFKEQSQETEMLVVADGDIARNQLNIINPNIPKGAPLPLGFDQYTQAQYGNSDFLENAVDYMLDETGLISIRSRELKIRLLDVNSVKQNKLFWQLVNTVVPIVSIILMGLIYLFIRKRKYTSV